MEDLRYLQAKGKFLEYAYRALTERFPSRTGFDKYFNAIQTDKQKNLFLGTAAFYLFLVKKGDWVLDIPNSNKPVDYFTNTYKYIAVFSLIESLSEKEFIDFYSFLVMRKSRIKFPIQSEQELKTYYETYKADYGALRRCISFFKALSPERQKILISKLQVKDTAPSIENLAKFLYELRSKFVHETKLILEMSADTVISRQGGVVCSLSIQDAMEFFEEGLIAHFRT